MKLSTLLISSILLGTVSLAQTATLREEGVSAIKKLGGTLKSELTTKMKQDQTGVIATGFCEGSAGTITKDINSKLPEYISVRRTALRTRNPENKADAIDAKIMKAYDEAIKAKTYDPKSAINIVKDGNTTRVYKPLLTEAACLKCHGTNISPQLTKLIKHAYPNDQATGFKEGDLRGVIVAEIKKH